MNFLRTRLNKVAHISLILYHMRHMSRHRNTSNKLIQRDDLEVQNCSFPWILFLNEISGICYIIKIYCLKKHFFSQVDEAYWCRDLYDRVHKFNLIEYKTEIIVLTERISNIFALVYYFYLKAKRKKRKIASHFPYIKNFLLGISGTF